MGHRFSSIVRAIAYAAIVSTLLPQVLWADALQPQLNQARQDYFHAMDGDHAAGERAKAAFDALRKQEPKDPTVLVYSGSLELLQAGHSFDIWKMRSLTADGLTDMDIAVQMAPDNLEVRYIRAATDYHLPFFLKRKAQAESDFSYLAPRVADAARTGALAPPLAASTLDYYGQILLSQHNEDAAHAAFAKAAQIDANSPGGKDAARHLESPSTGANSFR